MTERENLAEAEGEVRLYASESGDVILRRVLAPVLAEYDRRGRERDEALGLLKELADWADLAYRGVARPDGAEVIADALALVERASKGGQT